MTHYTSLDTNNNGPLLWQLAKEALEYLDKEES